MELAKNMLSPEECSRMLADGVKVKNSDIWARYVFREAYSIKDKDLGLDWVKFKEQLKESPITKQSQLDRYRKLFASRPLDDKKIAEGLEILQWLLSNKYIDQKLFMKGCAEILPQIDQDHDD